MEMFPTVCMNEGLFLLLIGELIGIGFLCGVIIEIFFGDEK